MTTRHSFPAWARIAGPGALLAALACLHPWLEQTMARHMGLELPALVLAGWLAGAYAGPGLARALAPWNANGLPGLLFAACVSGFWMLPAALDVAVLHPAVGTAKVASLVAAGLLLQASWSAAGIVIQAFFVLNWFWMTLGAGLIYQEAPQQLCSVYLADEQLHAGRAVAAWAVVGLAMWLWHVVRAAIRSDASPQDALPPRPLPAGPG
ncbi:hypothetical protein PE066_03730 [Ramlibacter tataouinensis]|uniref:hypothetical protein n=1 Tax=Ramlibacter tataouinensis TaxID=94132 RepID=UPI0022F3F24C|nr:hypothetical protein [Ramlibacter tataouinensis]WBY02660.1 hypothetical protein PE066_03730 [Ramlibacter tataouinensis]